MQLCTTQPLSNNPCLPKLAPPTAFLHSNSLAFSLRQVHTSPSTPRSCPSLLSRYRRSVSFVPCALSSEESSSEGDQYAVKDPDGAVAVGDVPPPETNSYTASGLVEVSEEEPAVDEQAASDFFADMNIKVDSEDTYSIIFYGASALVALSLASAIVGAIDTIPVFPKLMEVVGLGYSFWFTIRYLLFKENRDELATKINELKQQILGSE